MPPVREDSKSEVHENGPAIPRQCLNLFGLLHMGFNAWGAQQAGHHADAAGDGADAADDGERER